MKAIIGAIPRLAGKVTIFGQDMTGWSPAELTRAGVAYVPQQDDVFLPLSVYDNLLLGGYLLPHRVRVERVEERLAQFPALAAAGPVQREPSAVVSGRCSRSHAH